MAWTNEQLAAMQKNSGNLLLSAGAGSGKTAVLIERIMGIITDLAQPVDVDRLLVLTYTNAAAAEMRSRLTAALRQRLADVEAEAEAAHLTRQLVLLQRAKIMTIHAFCLDLLREYGYALELDPKSHIGNEGELNLLRERTLEEVFEAAYKEPESGLHLLLQHYSRGLGDDNIKALVLRLVEFGESMPDIEDWLAGLLAVYNKGQAAIWQDYFAEFMQDELAELGQLCRAAATLAKDAGLTVYLSLLQSDAAALTQIAALAANGDWPAGLTALAELEFKRLPAIRSKVEVDIEAKGKVQQLRKQVKDGCAALLREASPLLNGTLSEELRSQAPLAEALVNLALAYYQAWQQAKRRRRLLEFADLEHYALALLRDEQLGVAESLRQRFFEILVDEYQDINEVQESLLELLSNGENRFMVGDIKQSIYRFRLAEPSLFLRRFAAYGRGEGGRRIDLNRNFRSQSAVLAGVNFVFSRLMCGGNLEINYDEAAMLHCGRPELPQEPVELLIIDKAAVRSSNGLPTLTDGEAVLDENDDVNSANDLAGWSEKTQTAKLEDDLLEEMQTAEMEANLLAAKIREQQAQGRSLSDMVILLRAVRGWAPIFSQILRAQEIACVADGFDDFLSLPEVQVVHSLLAVLDNPRQNIPLTAVLHSPLVGLSLAELADLRILCKNLPPEFAHPCLYDGLLQSHDGRLLAFAQNLQDWRRRSLELGVAELLEYLYNATALPELLGSLPGGALRRGSLRELQRLAGEYDAAGGVGLGRFLQFLAAGNKANGSKRQQSAMGGGLDAVRLMSIHKSKGLEFPVVFVAGLGTAFNEEDFRQDILLHRSLGLAMRRVDLPGRRKYPTFGFNMITRKARWENLAESLRLLYVAMTRAENKLYLVGTVASSWSLIRTFASLAGPEYGHAEPVGAGFLAKHRNFLSWLCAALLQHPQADLLRQISGFTRGLAYAAADEDGPWRFELVTSLPKPVGAAQGAAQTFDFADWLAAGPEFERGPIEQALAREYPGAELARLPVKWSVTAFKRLLPLPEGNAEAEQAEAAARLADEYAENLARAESGRSLEWYAAYGSLVHALLQKADLAQVQRLLASEGAETAAVADYLQELLTGLAAGCADQTAPAAVAANLPRLAEFFSSSLGRRMLAANQVLREQRFIAGLSLAELAELDAQAAAGLFAQLAEGRPELNPQQFAQETVFLQGVLDLAFWEADGWVLVDYKSGGNRGKSAEQVREQYGLQLAIYRWALAKSSRQPVKEGYIYFTANGRNVRLF